MTEAERIKAKLKKERYKDTFFNIMVLLVFGGIVLWFIWNGGGYNPDKSLYVNYDLKTDLIPNPVQEDIPDESFTIRKYGVDITITKLASYDITGKVEAIKDYSTNFFSNMLSFSASNMTDYISPRDLTLSWGDIALSENSNLIQADQNYLNSQRVVWYSYKGELKSKYGEDHILSHISNNHIIALDNGLRRQLQKVKTLDIVRIKGYLVDVKCSNGVTWGPSSLTRTDDGFHSCEILYAEDIVIMPKNK